MTILVSYSSSTYKARVLTSPENGSRELYTATCTESELGAARAVVRRFFSDGAARTVREVRDPNEIATLLRPGFFADPKRKQIFAVFTFDHQAKVRHR